MRPLIYLIRSLVYSNLFISICITALAHQTYILLKIPQEDCFNVLALIFCSTFFTYNFQRIYRLRSVDLLGRLIGIRLGWMIRNRRKLFFASVFSVLMSFVFLIQLSIHVFLLIIPLSLFSMLYVIPFLPGKKAIRNLPFAKIFIISVVWSVVMVAIPVVNYNGFQGILKDSTVLLFLEQLIFIFAITLPFDVRDLRYDMESNIKTIPSSIGIKNTITLSHVLLIVFLVLKWIQYYSLGQLTLSQFVATAITTSLTFIIIAFTSRKRGELFFTGLVDGTMILMYLGILYLEY
ncbi:MAG: UbiA family prenyltransferase [Bacteroidetes bacterium]|nr:UbiA family prenyltransferase [Bacteroidota bacterium]